MPKAGVKLTQAKRVSPREEAVRHLEDLEAIRSLVAELNWLADEGRTLEMASHLTEDVVYDVGEYGLYRGRDAVQKFLTAIGSLFDLRVHRVTNQVIQLHSERARSRSYWNAELIWQGRALVGSGHYLDDLVKQGGQWFISARKTEITYLSPLEDGWARTRHFQLG